MRLFFSLLFAAIVTGVAPPAAMAADAVRTVVLRIDRTSAMRAEIEKAREQVREALRSARIGYTGLIAHSNFAQVRITDAENVERAKERLALLTGESSLFKLAEPEPRLLQVRPINDAFEIHFAELAAKAVPVLGRRVERIQKPTSRQQILNMLGGGAVTIIAEGDQVIVKISPFADAAQLERYLSTTAKVTFHMVDQSMAAEEALKGRPPRGSKIVYSASSPSVPYLLEDRVVLSGDNVVDAKVSADPRTNSPVVMFQLDEAGTTRFGQITRQNAGRLAAIVLDNQVLSAPQIGEPITDGTGQISGDFTVEAAEKLAALLGAGALPADFIITKSD